MKKSIQRFLIWCLIICLFLPSCTSYSSNWETTQSIETMEEFDANLNNIDYWKQIRFDVFNGSIPRTPFCNYYKDWLKKLEDQKALFTSIWELCFYQGVYEYHDWLSDSFDG